MVRKGNSLQAFESESGLEVFGVFWVLTLDFIRFKSLIKFKQDWKYNLEANQRSQIKMSYQKPEIESPPITLISQKRWMTQNHPCTMIIIARSIRPYM